MSIVLPRSLNKDLHPVQAEVAFARSLTPEQRLAVVAKVCHATLLLLNAHSKRERVLQMRDPLPESSRAALHRLRIQR